MVEHDHAVAQLGGVVHVVGGHDDGAALRMQLAQQPQELAAAAGVKAGNGLVEHEDVRLHGEHAGEGNAPLLAAGERKGGDVTHGLGVEADAAYGFVNARGELRARDAEVSRAKGHVLANRAREQLALGILEHDAHAARGLARNAPAGWLLELGQQLHERGLARPRVAEKAEDLALAHLDRDVPQRRAAPTLVGKRHVLDPQRAAAFGARGARGVRRRLGPLDRRGAQRRLTPLGRLGLELAEHGVDGHARGEAWEFLSQLEANAVGHRDVEAKAGQHVCLREHLVRRAVERHAPVAEHDDALGLGGLLHEVGDHDDRHALAVEPVARMHERGAPTGVEHGACLVEHERLRTHGEHAGKCQALLLPAGQACRLAPLEAG